jgi:hypothetical protein
MTLLPGAMPNGYQGEVRINEMLSTVPVQHLKRVLVLVEQVCSHQANRGWRP